MKLNSALRSVSLASMLTTAGAAQAEALVCRNPRPARGEPFLSFLSRIGEEKETAVRNRIIDRYLDSIRATGRPVIEDSSVVLLYRGNARRVGVPSDLNGWNPSLDTMKRVPGSDLFYLDLNVEKAARFEYKFFVDSAWILDPLNMQQAMGGHGPNSEVWMPLYSPPKEIAYRSDIRHGAVDTVTFKSSLLGRTHPVFIYKPPGYARSRTKFPVIYVTDGGEYISLALMLNVLDNLIADKRIEPVVGVFMDPRTDVRDPSSNRRMTDYALSDTFVNAIVHELRPPLMKKYRLTTDPGQTALLGASFGGLIATYASLTHPDVFGLCAAQSPSYWWNDDAIFSLADSLPRQAIRFSLDTGTIKDAQEKARKMRRLLKDKGYDIQYGEYPEGHNWVNWRARLATILTYFWGKH